MLAIILTHNVDQQRWHLGKTMWHQPQGSAPQAGNIGKQLKYYNLPANMIAGKFTPRLCHVALFSGPK